MGEGSLTQRRNAATTLASLAAGLRSYVKDFLTFDFRYVRISVIVSLVLLLVSTFGCTGCEPLYTGRDSGEPLCCDDSGPGEDPSDGGSDGGLDAGEEGEERCSPCPLTVERLFPSAEHPVERYAACHFASPLSYEGSAGPRVLLSVGHQIVAIDPLTGARDWGVELPAPLGEMGFVVGTPLLLEDRLVVAYHTTTATPDRRDVIDTRHRHRVVVIDLESGSLDSAFEGLELGGSVLDADGEEVPFEPRQNLGRAQLVGGKLPGDAFGKVYVTFGNARDIQPWHGFAIEVDLDLWLAEGRDAAITGFFVDTPESDCGPRGQSGSRERVCGGGLWAPTGPLLLPREEGYELILASGNGQLDLAREDYANTLMRLGPGLTFDPGCDPVACADFDRDSPSQECVESCSALFIPRMPAGEDFSALVSEGRCQGDTLFECWAKLDYIGGSTPARVTLPGFELLLYPTKDGAVYLVDAAHLGTLYERRQLVPICGTATSPCRWDWAGMIVTKPTMTTHDGLPLALVPTFMPDGEQEAGLVALQVKLVDGIPALEELWRWPAAGSEAARTRFRVHPSRVSLMDLPDGREIALVVEPTVSGSEPGRLLALEVATGALLLDAPLDGRGYRFLQPLVREDRVYLPSCETNAGDAWIEGYRIATVSSDAP